MRLDNFNNPIFDDTDVFNALYQNKASVLSDIFVDQSPDLDQLSKISGIKFPSIPTSNNEVEYDQKCQDEWFMPNHYRDFNIKQFCLDQCSTQQEYDRILEELREFEKRNMMVLLQWLKYFVDTCRENKILWGVGRGSSVASYVLYRIGVHRIDSIKYNLSWQEFLR